MNKIEVNSVESVILFVLYICVQDGKISDEELNELAIEFPLLEKLYFDIYGEYVHHDFQETVDQVIKKLNPIDRFIGKTISKFEKNIFNTLITDPKIKDIALLESRHAAAVDGFHDFECAKYDYWAKQWS
jgi:hypothetical protein